MNKSYKLQSGDIKKRTTECMLRLEAIHKMRWNLNSEDIDPDYYFEANEVLNEIENRIWSYINGKVDTF